MKRALILLCLLACAPKRIPETSDWEADAKTIASMTLLCPVKDLVIESIDRSFVESGGRYVAKGITARARGCGKEAIFIWTPDRGWVPYEPEMGPIP